MQQQPQQPQHTRRMMLPPIQAVFFYSQLNSSQQTPFYSSNQLPPIKLSSKNGNDFQCHIPKRACIHRSNKIFCPDCDGRAICKHGKNRYICKECGGSSICQHKKRRYLCSECRLPNKKKSYAKVIVVSAATNGKKEGISPAVTP